MEAANAAKKLILKENETARVDVLKLDLCSIKSVRAFVDNFNALDVPLNILMWSLYLSLNLSLSLFTKLINELDNISETMPVSCSAPSSYLKME